ncbi:MATE family efflux transporter [Nonomuraea sp. NPDC003754]
MYRLLASAALPLLLSSVTGLTGSLVVTATLGRHDTSALAAFALTMAVHQPASMAVIGGLRGLAPFVAPHRDEPVAAIPVLRDARWLALAIGTAGALAVACVPLVAAVSGAAVTGFGALPYLLACSLLVGAANGGVSTVLVALGHGGKVLRAGVAATAAAVVLVAVLVPWWGPAGAGLAYLGSSLAGAAVANHALRRVLGRPIGRGRPRPREIRKIARVSLPLSATMLIKFAGLGVLAYAAARTGATGAAAHAIVYALTGFLMVPALAVAQAAVPEIARAGGACGKRRVARVALTLAGAAAAAGAGLLLAFDGVLVRLFTGDPAVRAQVSAVVMVALGSSMAEAASAVLGFALTAMKRSARSLRSVAVGWGLLVVAAGPVVGAWGLVGLWTAVLATHLLLVALQGLAFLSVTADRHVVS